MILKARQHVIEFPRRPLVMGIVNINDDSFCGDGTLHPTAALAQHQPTALVGPSARPPRPRRIACAHLP
jgi:hypothetical protein